MNYIDDDIPIETEKVLRAFISKINGDKPLDIEDFLEDPNHFISDDNKDVTNSKYTGSTPNIEEVKSNKQEPKDFSKKTCNDVTICKPLEMKDPHVTSKDPTKRGDANEKTEKKKEKKQRKTKKSGNANEKTEKKKEKKQRKPRIPFTKLPTDEK